MADLLNNFLNDVDAIKGADSSVSLICEES